MYAMQPTRPSTVTHHALMSCGTGSRTAAILSQVRTCSRVAAAAVQQQRLDVSSNPCLGPIVAQNIEGAGRGVVVTRDVQPGELLMCCHPLAVVTGPPHQRQSVDSLQAVLATTPISPHASAALQQLYDGTPASLDTLPDLQAMVTTWQQQQQPAADDSHSQGQGQASQQAQQAGQVLAGGQLQRLAGVVRHNAYADLHDDLAAAAAAGRDPASLIGLWPGFSLFNHSCAPNCINWVLPGEPRAMVVRAARPIPAGREATISYLGGPQLLPLPGRHQALAGFGFACRCARCVAEEDVPPAVEGLMDDITSRVRQSFEPRLSQAVAARDTGTMREVRHQAAAMMSALYAQLRRHVIPPGLRQQLLASCFGCLEVCADSDAALGDSDALPSSLGKCLEAVAAVSPGSDLHCILAAKLHMTAQASSVSHQDSSGGASSSNNSSSREQTAAWRACVDAHTARYGPLSVPVLQQLVDLNNCLYT